MSNEVIICEKPNSISWDAIKECLYKAHTINRSRGINMTHYQWPAEKIREYIGPNGVMLVALVDGNKLVGTAAIKEAIGSAWYNNGRYAYACFDGILPEYAGKGIFKKLDAMREDIARDRGYDLIVFDTNSNNKHRIDIAKKNNYRLVRYFCANDHYNVNLVKWLNSSPYPDWYCMYRYQRSKLKKLIQKFISSF